jgi:hypothetical protein
MESSLAQPNLREASRLPSPAQHPAQMLVNRISGAFRAHVLILKDEKPGLNGKAAADYQLVSVAHPVGDNKPHVQAPRIELLLRDFSTEY